MAPHCNRVAAADVRRAPSLENDDEPNKCNWIDIQTRPALELAAPFSDARIRSNPDRPDEDTRDEWFAHRVLGARCRSRDEARQKMGVGIGSATLQFRASFVGRIPLSGDLSLVIFQVRHVEQA